MSPHKQNEIKLFYQCTKKQDLHQKKKCDLSYLSKLTGRPRNKLRQLYVLISYYCGAGKYVDASIC